MYFYIYIFKVTKEDIIMARGHSLTPIQKAERISRQTKTIQGLSLLATWTPKKEYKRSKIFCDIQWPKKYLDTQAILKLYAFKCIK